MLRYGKELQVRESHVPRIGNQVVGQFAVGQVPPVPFFRAFPGPQVNFVYGDGGGDRRRRRPFRHPRLVGPAE